MLGEGGKEETKRKGKKRREEKKIRIRRMGKTDGKIMIYSGVFD